MAGGMSCWLVVLLVGVLFAAFDANVALKLPSFIKPCELKDPKFNECVVHHANAALESGMVQGDKKLRIPSLQPFVLPEVKINTNTLAATVTNLSISGLDETRIKSMEFDFKSDDKLEVVAQADIPRLNFTGSYVIKGQLLILPISGNGPINLNFYNNDVTVRMNFEAVEKDGKRYGRIVSTKWTNIPKFAKFYLGNLFNGDKRLGDNMNRVLNENWRDVIQELDNPLSETMASIVQLYVSSIIERIPVKEIFV